MATVTSVVLYDVAIPGAGTAHLVAVGTLVTDATTVPPGQNNSATVDYFVQGTPGSTPAQLATRAPISREDFLAIRLLKAMA